MPTHEEHCQHSLKRVGIRGDKIHTWMDEPCKIFGGGHRRFRHGSESMVVAIQVFGPDYGTEWVREVFLDHLLADNEYNSTPRENKDVHKEVYHEELTLSLISLLLALVGLIWNWQITVALLIVESIGLYYYKRWGLLLGFIILGFLIWMIFFR